MSCLAVTLSELIEPCKRERALELDCSNEEQIFEVATFKASTKGAEGRPTSGQSLYWSEEEHHRFLEVVQCYGAQPHGCCLVREHAQHNAGAQPL
jgi:hypothetical protein